MIGHLKKRSSSNKEITRAVISAKFKSDHCGIVATDGEGDILVIPVRGKVKRLSLVIAQFLDHWLDT